VINMSDYSIKDHRHKFATWAAASGAYRGFTTKKNLVESIEEADLRKIVENKNEWVKSPEEYDSLHKKLAQDIIKSLKSKDVKGEITYGRASKLIALYFKTSIVINGHPTTKFAEVIHPPIDRKLLQSLSKREEYPTKLKNFAWTKLSKEKYFELINILRKVDSDKPFWKLERYWRPYKI